MHTHKVFYTWPEFWDRQEIIRNRRDIIKYLEYFSFGNDGVYWRVK